MVIMVIIVDLMMTKTVFMMLTMKMMLVMLRSRSKRKKRRIFSSTCVYLRSPAALTCFDLQEKSSRIRYSVYVINSTYALMSKSFGNRIKMIIKKNIFKKWTVKLSVNVFLCKYNYC